MSDGDWYGAKMPKRLRVTRGKNTRRAGIEEIYVCSVYCRYVLYFDYWVDGEKGT